MDALDWLRTISGALFFIEFIAYSITAFIFYQRHYHAFSAVLFDNIVISGLNALLAVYLLDGGDLQWAWLTYSFSCVYLAITFYRVLTFHVSCSQYEDLSIIEGDPPYAYYAMCIATFVTIVAGLVINLLASQVLRWVVFVLSFVPFAFAIMFLFRAVKIVTRGQEGVPRWVRIAVYINLAFWSGYPVVMVLGPLFINTISAKQEALGYITLDFVTKHLSMALFAGYIGIEINRVVHEHVGFKKEMSMKLTTLASSSRA